MARRISSSTSQSKGEMGWRPLRSWQNKDYYSAERQHLSGREAGAGSLLKKGKRTVQLKNVK